MPRLKAKYVHEAGYEGNTYKGMTAGFAGMKWQAGIRRYAGNSRVLK
ncbi:MAG: hypothetical protein GX754_08600 [Clostridiaceae bacterium]|nr:hypothetical protein [Clostridiaceae bacterium]